jgi:heptosyltransferase-2
LDTLVCCMKTGAPKSLRMLVVLPSWVGDVVMATPALRLIRDTLRASFVGGLCRPGLEELLAGSDFFDEVHVERARGIMGPKIVAAKVRPRRYDTALLLTNSFSTALVTRLAFIPRRIGYDRDGRGMLLTEKLSAPRRERPHHGWAPVSAVDYYLEAARAALGREGEHRGRGRDGGVRLELRTTLEQERAADDILAQVGISPEVKYAVLNPGGNNAAKRWPPERFAAVGRHLRDRHGLRVVVNGSPGELELSREVAKLIGEKMDARVAVLAELGATIGSMMAVVRRASVMVTNDTGPRHIAAAFDVPTVSLLGPTDPRWTTLPERAGSGGRAREVVLVADPTLPPEEVADDHPERCRVDRIEVATVIGAVDDLLGSAGEERRVAR